MALDVVIDKTGEWNQIFELILLVDMMWLKMILQYHFAVMLLGFFSGNFRW